MYHKRKHTKTKQTRICIIQMRNAPTQRLNTPDFQSRKIRKQFKWKPQQNDPRHYDDEKTLHKTVTSRHSGLRAAAGTLSKSVFQHSQSGMIPPNIFECGLAGQVVVRRRLLAKNAYESVDGRRRTEPSRRPLLAFYSKQICVRRRRWSIDPSGSGGWSCVGAFRLWLVFCVVVDEVTVIEVFVYIPYVRSYFSDWL